jgi:hypothetical protein
MAVRQYGSQSYKFGFNDPAALAIASSIGIQPQTLTIDAEPEFEAEGKNLFSETEAYARGSAKRSFTMEGYIIDETLFEQVLAGTASATFVFKSQVYIVKGGKRTVKNNEFQMGETTGVGFPKITDQVGTQLN